MSANYEEIKEKLAAIEHERWADWMEWLFDEFECGKMNPDGSFTIRPDRVKWWKRQIATPYKDLSDFEQASDMEQVDRYWPLIEAHTKDIELEARLDTVKKLNPYLNNKLDVNGQLEMTKVLVELTAPNQQEAENEL